MAIKVGAGKGTMAEPNVVPLIDILLVLIIIFMVITPLVPKGLEALVPQPPPRDQQQRQEDISRLVVVQVLYGGGLKINQDNTDWETMGSSLEAIFKTRAEKVAFIKGDDQVLFGEIARAIDIMRGSGIEKVGLITTRIEAGQ